jgi:hemoglobin
MNSSLAPSLYEKYGGIEGIRPVVSSFYGKILSDESLAPYFAHLDMDRMMDHQTRFLSVVLGGPNLYQGRPLQAAHKRLNVTEDAFASVATHLKAALEEAGVEPQDVATILGVVAGAKGDVVSSEAAPTPEPAETDRSPLGLGSESSHREPLGSPATV